MTSNATVFTSQPMKSCSGSSNSSHDGRTETESTEPEGTEEATDAPDSQNYKTSAVAEIERPLRNTTEADNKSSSETEEEKEEENSKRTIQEPDQEDGDEGGGISTNAVVRRPGPVGKILLEPENKNGASAAVIAQDTAAAMLFSLQLPIPSLTTNLIHQLARDSINDKACHRFVNEHWNSDDEQGGRGTLSSSSALSSSPAAAAASADRKLQLHLGENAAKDDLQDHDLADESAPAHSTSRSFRTSATRPSTTDVVFFEPTSTGVMTGDTVLLEEPLHETPRGERDHAGSDHPCRRGAGEEEFLHQRPGDDKDTPSLSSAASTASKEITNNSVELQMRLEALSPGEDGTGKGREDEVGTTSMAIKNHEVDDDEASTSSTSPTSPGPAHGKIYDRQRRIAAAAVKNGHKITRGPGGAGPGGPLAGGGVDAAATAKNLELGLPFIKNRVRFNLKPEFQSIERRGRKAKGAGKMATSAGRGAAGVGGAAAGSSSSFLPNERQRSALLATGNSKGESTTATSTGKGSSSSSSKSNAKISPAKVASNENELPVPQGEITNAGEVDESEISHDKHGASCQGAIIDGNVSRDTVPTEKENNMALSTPPSAERPAATDVSLAAELALPTTYLQNGESRIPPSAICSETTNPQEAGEQQCLSPREGEDPATADEAVLSVQPKDVDTGFPIPTNADANNGMTVPAPGIADTAADESFETEKQEPAQLDPKPDDAAAGEEEPGVLFPSREKDHDRGISSEGLVGHSRQRSGSDSNHAQDLNHEDFKFVGSASALIFEPAEQREVSLSQLAGEDSARSLPPPSSSNREARSAAKSIARLETTTGCERTQPVWNLSLSNDDEDDDDDGDHAIQDAALPPDTRSGERSKQERDGIASSTVPQPPISTVDTTEVLNAPSKRQEENDKPVRDHVALAQTCIDPDLLVQIHTTLNQDQGDDQSYLMRKLRRQVVDYPVEQQLLVWKYLRKEKLVLKKCNDPTELSDMTKVGSKSSLKIQLFLSQLIERLAEILERGNERKR
ncbi:unnamed protein product [Amoebophrya sp. A120]|nr:unnamed protein product [Amoebophrya sp. A120]|eukprot:GSA120T00016096001.1